MKIFLVLILHLTICANVNAQNWNLVWADSFNNSIKLQNWKFEIGDGGWGNNELQYYTNRADNALVSNGNLLIIAKKENYQGSNYTSARMVSKDLQTWTYGKIEARIKLQQTQGVWPAFWMLGNNINQVSWPTCGELDILEHINTENKIYGTMHWNNNGHVQAGNSAFCNATQYHLYGIEWSADSIKWLLDNNVYYKNTIKNSINNTSAFHLPFFIILNMAVGGNWPGSPATNSVFPDTMFVDYIHVFQNFPTAVSAIQNSKLFNFYPNPAEKTVKINLETLQENSFMEICIYNVYGTIVKKYTSTKNMNNELELSLFDFPKGIYFLTLKSNQQQWTNKLILQ
ncbi:MAG: hypothetical protein RLZZ118_92 [Bacteroidota bacterium]|jgi:beta-glucanase (GH16 family)